VISSSAKQSFGMYLGRAGAVCHVTVTHPKTCYFVHRRDKPSADPDTNLYSSHPFYLQVNAGGYASHA
jgi:hypothetical protein